MKLCPNFGNKDQLLSPTNQVKFGEIQVISSPLPQKQSSSHMIKPTHHQYHQHHKSEPNNYNLHRTPTTPKDRMRELGFKVQKNLNKQLPPVPIRHLPQSSIQNYLPCQELKNSEFPKFGFRTGLDKMYISSSTPHLNHFDSNSLQKPILKPQARPDPPLYNTNIPVIQPKFNRNPPPPLNLAIPSHPPKPIIIKAPTQRVQPITKLASISTPSDLSQFISKFQNTLPPGEDDSSLQVELKKSPTEFDWIKNMKLHHPQLIQNNRQSYSIKGHLTDLSGLDAPFTESFLSTSISSPTNIISPSDSDSHSEHSLITPKDDTTNSPLSQTLDILCGDSNYNSFIDTPEQPISIALSDIARANLGKWSQLRERKLTRRGKQAAGVGSSQRMRFRDAHPTPVAKQLPTHPEIPSITFSSTPLAQKIRSDESNLSYDLTGILESYNYPRHRDNRQGYDIHDDVSSIINLYLDPETILEPPALSTATSHDGDEDEAHYTLDEVKSSLGLLERIHQGLKLTIIEGSECEDIEAGGDFIDLYFPDLAYCQNGSPNN